MIQRSFHYLRKHSVIERTDKRDTDPAIKPQYSNSRKGNQPSNQKRDQEGKMGAKASVKAVTKFSVSNSDINYQNYLSFNLEDTPGNFMAGKTE